MEQFNILVPPEIPIDETVLVIAVHFESGAKIEKSVPIFEIETSKTAYVLITEVSGILDHMITVGDEVKSGQILGVVRNDR
jgi:pyruvate/2-oxoglutarate dehydrogenase complex dihydrolipoamide acyltransferase (E2) component